MDDWVGALLAYERKPSKLFAGLFPKQRAFLEDPARFRAALCGRRAGKTEGVARWLLDGAERTPGSTTVYIALSQKNARRILWNTLLEVARKADIGAVPNEQTLELRLPNGSRVWVTGCPDRAQCEDFRGLKLRRAAIDEAGSFPDWLAYLVEDVLIPALMDLRGELALSGSPGLVPVGYFYERTEGDRPWPTHRWTCLDNPHVGGAEEIERLKKENNWAADHPTLVREWMGQWVRDDSALVYPFKADRNIGEMPDPQGQTVVRVLAVDPGFDDPTAFVLGASIVGHPELYIERAWRRSGLTVAGIAGQIEQLRHAVHIDRIVVDQGGLGKMIAHDLSDTYGIPCEPAEKSAKQTAIHAFRGGLLSGQIKIAPLACQQLREEWTTCAWNETRDDHDERCPDDCCDASLYVYRAALKVYTPELNAPKEGTPEWAAQYKRERIAALERERRTKRRTA